MSLAIRIFCWRSPSLPCDRHQALKASEGFSRLWPSVITVIGYGIAFWCLSLTLKVIPTGIVYAIGRAWASC